ncbi:unnamed protein product [Brachionus calyciflorus]|uniref:Uncharacterized protein n=1 Tax=Brachionus calyciflorus TaxID=104777 RepID=A0A814QIK8_9BILA|nr:unnamed protein product [Brachionus calyciflorus]
MKGCHFHFTQSIWKNIQKNGLSDEYSRVDAVYEWLNMFKSLAFIKPEYIESAWHLIERFILSSNQKFQDFLTYFRDTWYGNERGKFSYSLWNHFYTEGPRTNNHVEGYNHKINNYIDYTHQHIYSPINTLKVLETSTGLNYYQRELGGLSQFPRRPKDIQRDVMINYLKNKLEVGDLGVLQFLTRMGNLFRFDKSNKKTRFTFTENLISNESFKPVVSIFKISNQSFNFISCYIKNNRDFMVTMVKNFRTNKGICFYNSNYYDLNHHCVLKKGDCYYGVCLQTTGDGNCLYSTN